MTVYTFDNTLDGLLTAVFDSFALHQQEVTLLCDGEQLPLFAGEPHRVHTDEAKASRVWKGLEKHLSREALHIITVSWQSEERELNQPLFNLICKVFRTTPDPSLKMDIMRNASDPDVLAVRNTCRRVLHEVLRMKQFIRFQKAKDGTYIAVVSPDHDVLPMVIDHFQDRFRDQPWLIYDAKRHYGYYCTEGNEPIRITFEDEAAVPFDLQNGKLSDNVLSENDHLFQDLWRTYFKAICIRERMNPCKQLSDMPRRYWRYMTEKN
jgi:probable DNA metabolism protein